MPEIEVALTVVVETGLSVGGSGSSGVRADKTIQRNGREQPIIPASQVKGRLRHTCETIMRAAGITICRPPDPETTCPHQPGIGKPGIDNSSCPLCLIFGSAWQNSPLRFRDLVYKEPVKIAPDSAIRPGIGLERRRGVAQEGLLFFTETTLPGTSPAFYCDTAITGLLKEEGPALLLLAGLDLIPHWGGGKSRGMGWAITETEARFNGQSLNLAERKEVLTAWFRQHTGS